MLDRQELVDAGRRAFAGADWAAALDFFTRARDSGPLETEDVVSLARCAWWLGRVPEALAAAEEAFRAYSATGREEQAAMTALQLTLLWVTRADVTVGVAWLNRARRLLEGLSDRAAHAYLAYLEAAVAVVEGDATSGAHVSRLADLAIRFPEPGVQALSLVAAGLAQLRDGDTRRGFALLDEAMLPVLAEEIPVEWAGDIYCTLMHVCHELAEHRRMEDWTRATERWCRSLGSEAVYSGICRVHRLELRTARGEWADLETDLSRVSADLAGGSPWVAGEGFYQLGELRRLRGDAPGAAEAYAQARAVGIDPQPGEALLALGAGDGAAAWSAIRAALATRDALGRVRLLRAGVEIALAEGHRDDARTLADELRAAAQRYASRGFQAWSDHAAGMVHLVEGDATRALASLRAAADAFRRERQSYENARVLALMARAHDAVGDHGSAAGTRAAAHEIVTRLGADAATLDGSAAAAASTGPLTVREAEVIEQVARGASNREVAAALFISENTVSRHLANIYVKAGVGSRTAAVAWWRERASG